MPSQLYTIIKHHLSRAARHVKTVHLNIEPYLTGLPDLLSFFPSLENIFCHPHAYFPNKLSFIPPSIQSQVKAIQMRVPNLKNLAIPRFLRQLRWLSLMYETESMHLALFLETLENLPNLQFLHLTQLSKLGQMAGTEGLKHTITLHELMVLITNCPIIHLIDAPKISHLDLHVIYPLQPPVKDTYGHLCRFDFAKINHLHFDVDHGMVTGNPTHKWKDFGNEINLMEITLEAFDPFPLDQGCLDSLSKALRLATTIRNLTILPGYGSLSQAQVLFNLLSDGSLLPHLEKLRYFTRCDKKPGK
ncbi:hypothetical protein Clacol_001845 [Clathrus columnatus]|uniref:Uncharacterized protein n=1 Tax=Clathrus columnatus TaxID=1419009 RepID=A0AAV5A4W3_9AGAM|nr:hypothetical protein Clacol_001845 [Clathrus columnatus]